jgi:integrase
MRRKVLVNFKTILSFAQRQGLVAQNVALPVKIRTDDRAESSGPVREGHDFPTKTEIKMIIESATGRWRPFAITAIFTGMRASELRGLIWANVDLEKGIIHVRQRAYAWGHIGKPKSKAGNRDIPLPPMVVNALKQWRERCPVGGLGLVFPNGRGNIESHNNIVKRWWGPLQVRLGMVAETGKVDAQGSLPFRQNTTSTAYGTPLLACLSRI